MRYALALLLLLYLLCLPRKLFDVPYSTVVTDRKGELLGARIADDGQWRFPQSGDGVPEKFKTCIISFEDRYFKYHPGVNPFAILRALKQNITEKRIVSGGSTLTMQAVRLSRGENRTVAEKIMEAILATRLECHYSKDEILAMYAAHAPFGGNVVGLEAAAWRYFGRPPGMLSWAETATLAVLPNAPSMIHPARNRLKLLEKRNRLLKNLFSQGALDSMQYELALSEALPSEPLPLPQTAPHLVSGFYLSDGGKKTVSTIDKHIQQQVEGILDRCNSELIRHDIRNMAALVIDVETNDVLAYCGNVQFDDGKSSNQVDIIRAPRSSGSLLKPLLYYIMLKEGEILPNTLIPDIPVNINGFVPQNFNRQYDGAVPASGVISRSLNIPSVHMLRQYGAPKFYDFLKKAGMTTLLRPSRHYGLSLILGGAETTLWDISYIYSDMARTLCGLERTAGNVLLNKQRESLPQVFDANAVWQVFDAIKEVNRPGAIDRHDIPSVHTIAWKTGTSYGFRDAWAVGVTRRYVVGVWVGNASGEGKPELVGGRTAGPVMFDIFNLLPEAPWFDRPADDFVEAAVCRESGHLSGRFCEHIDTLLIVPNGNHTGACPYHTSINLSPDGQFRVYESCIEAGQQVETKKWFVLPPVWEWYYRQHHPEYKSLPPFMPGCGEGSISPMAFIYPQRNAQIYLPRQLDGSPGELTCELAHRKSSSTVYWHLDTDYLGTTHDFHRFTFRSPSPGRHRITVVDSEGNTLSVSVTIE
jgi:penicillin-binding protein 1C